MISQHLPRLGLQEFTITPCVPATVTTRRSKIRDAKDFFPKPGYDVAVRNHLRCTKVNQSVYGESCRSGTEPRRDSGHVGSQGQSNRPLLLVTTIASSRRCSKLMQFSWMLLLRRHCSASSCSTENIIFTRGLRHAIPTTPSSDSTRVASTRGHHTMNAHYHGTCHHLNSGRAIGMQIQPA